MKIAFALILVFAGYASAQNNSPTPDNDEGAAACRAIDGLLSTGAITLSEKDIKLKESACTLKIWHVLDSHKYLYEGLEEIRDVNDNIRVLADDLKAEGRARLAYLFSEYHESLDQRCDLITSKDIDYRLFGPRADQPDTEAGMKACDNLDQLVNRGAVRIYKDSMMALNRYSACTFSYGLKQQAHQPIMDDVSAIRDLSTELSDLGKKSSNPRILNTSQLFSEYADDIVNSWNSGMKAKSEFRRQWREYLNKRERARNSTDEVLRDELACPLNERCSNNNL